jgi:hypothetical protein
MHADFVIWTNNMCTTELRSNDILYQHSFVARDIMLGIFGIAWQSVASNGPYRAVTENM